MKDRPRLSLIIWPFHNGLADFGMGVGSRVLGDDENVQEALRSTGWSLSRQMIPPADESHPEIARVMDLIRQLANAVSETVSAGEFPLVLAGSCNSCLGTVTGVGSIGLGVVWFDAHADFDTPEDNVSGFFDVMGLAMLTGSGWSGLRNTIPGFSPIDERDVILAAVRDLAPHQRQRLASSRIRAAPGDLSDDSLARAVDDLRKRVNDVYLHVDLDSLDKADGVANEYAAPGGPSLDRLLAAIHTAFDEFHVRAAALTAYDPAYDRNGTAGAAARKILHTIAEKAYEQRMGT